MPQIGPIQKFVALLLVLKLTSADLNLNDGQVMNIDIDATDNNALIFDIDKDQFDIPLKRREPGLLDFLPADLRQEAEEMGVEKDFHKLNKGCFLQSFPSSLRNTPNYLF